MAHIAEPRVRETSVTTGTNDLVLSGAMIGSLAFAQVMTAGDTCDYVAQYDTTFEEGLGTFAADGKLERTTIYKARHANGDVNATKVSFATGVKTIIMTYRAKKIARVDVPQAFSAGEKAQHRANVPPFESGTRLIFQQTAAPVGWTKDVSSHNDKVLRFTTGTVGSGGIWGFSTVFGKSATDNTTINSATMPSHAHGGLTAVGGVDHNHVTPVNAQGANANSGQGASTSPFSGVTNYSSTTSSAYLHAHGIPAEGSSLGHSHPMDIRVQYADAIIATAN